MIGQNLYPWLKVLITSRPESWMEIRRHVPLADDRYYRERASNTRWIQLKEFSIKLNPFEYQELGQVYEKYREVYQIQNEFSALPLDLREILSNDN
jgi:hypothetical protein